VIHSTAQHTKQRKAKKSKAKFYWRDVLFVCFFVVRVQIDVCNDDYSEEEEANRANRRRITFICIC
jgi:hypothetical protein